MLDSRLEPRRPRISSGVKSGGSQQGRPDQAGIDVEADPDLAPRILARIKELGFEGMLKPVKITCGDHEGARTAQVQQWDGKNWKVISDWYTARPDYIEALVKDDIAKAMAIFSKAEREAELDRIKDVMVEKLAEKFKLPVVAIGVGLLAWMEVWKGVELLHKIRNAWFTFGGARELLGYTVLIFIVGRLIDVYSKQLHPRLKHNPERGWHYRH